VPRRFPNTDIAPHQLRPLLRSALSPGERLIAWGVGAEHPPASTALFRIAITAIPMVGLALSAAVGGPRHRLLLLTDQRLLILSGEARDLRHPGAAIATDASLGALTVKVGSLGMSYLISTPGRQPLSLAIDPKQSRPTERLCFALTMMDPERADSVARLMPGAAPILALGYLDDADPPASDVPSEAEAVDPSIFTDPQS
jgi:hypothetical protein